MLIFLTAALASAWTNPDRPSVSMSPALVMPDSIELEAGGLWHRESGAASPVRLKYAFQDRFELRVDANPLGAADVGPGLIAGAKIPLAEGQAGVFTGFLGSALPIASGEAWTADAMVLWGKGVQDWGFTINAGVRLDGDGGVGLVGVPLVLAVSGPAPTDFAWFVEGASILGEDGPFGSVIDGGVFYNITEQLTVDIGAGYTLDDGAPYAQAGVTANFGKMSKK